MYGVRAGSAAVVISLVALALVAPDPNLTPSSERCLPGYTDLREGSTTSELHADIDSFERDSGVVHCVPMKRPEPYADMAAEYGGAAAQKIAPFSRAPAGAYLAALRQRDRMAAQRPRIFGSDGLWSPLGTTPLKANEAGYDEVNSAGWVDVAGRISDYAFDPRSGTLYAAVAQGGLWRSDNMGETWRSVGDKLPSQTLGAVDYTRADGGTLIVSTGDNAFCFNCVTGLGVYRSTDNGRSWQRGKGVPGGSLTFALEHDPTNPKEIYAATGFGLYRSTDAGRSFRNTRLPTTGKRCLGHPHRRDCFLRSVVTDVIVQAPDEFGNKGGRVMAAVGWRAGMKRNVDTGKRQAKKNGIYVSNSGKPGSFEFLDTPGFTKPRRRGRTELGIATGPDQDHNYVYAIVQDAVKLNGGAPGIDANESPAGKIPYATVLEGIYSSDDFGQTWVPMVLGEELGADATSGSALAVAGAAQFYLPGVQAWYNEWITPDPTVTDPATGAPGRLAFGLEEVWENEVAGEPMFGPTKFKVIGRYWDYCLFLISGAPTCPTNRPEQTGETTTHPDQHDGILVPDGDGGVTLIAGNDGGAYTQHAAPGADFSNANWGPGANVGFNTLLPYDAKMAKDGTVWAGLQDNGTMKITPDGRQIMAYGGDGFFVAVDPDNSNIAYEEYTSGAMAVTTDGGRTWRSINPGLTNPAFSVPFAMDPRDAKHLMIGGRDIVETTYGPQTATSGNEWATVYDLGTQDHPGDASATQTLPEDPSNRLSAVDLVGDAAYVGYCGFCDTITNGVPFKSGLATNVGGKDPAKAMTSQGWHIARTRGLPDRFITSVEIDANDPKTVFLTLAGYGRRWAEPGSVGEIPKNVAGGHLYRSDDAGRTFRDISGNLPDVPFNYVLKRGKQLIAGSDIEVFISNDLRGSRWAPLGRGLPNVAISTMTPVPGDDKAMVVATFGRGVWLYRFP